MRKIIKRLSFFLIIILVGLLLLEVLLTLAFTYKDRNLEPLNVKDHPYLYYSFKAEDALNEDGFKTDKNISKDSDRYRIILVGGSVARSSGKLENGIAHFLEAKLNSSLNVNSIEVVNAGVSGYVVQQEFLLTQMVLPKYNADMIISLSGFNDAFTYHRNNFRNVEGIAPPHNWRNFKVIEMNKMKRSFTHRFSGIFKSIFRIIDYYNFNKRADTTEVSYEDLAYSYWNTVQDAADLSTVKNIRYFHFIQPVRDFREPDKSVFNDHRINEFYEEIINRSSEIDYAFDMSGTFDGKKEHYTDYCHLDIEGNQILANKIANILAPLINHDSKFHRISGFNIDK